jgi:tetratricopeptide (TPR) repeat protein
MTRTAAAIALLLAAVVAACAGRGGRFSKAEVAALYRSGLERFDAGDHRGALRYFQAVREAEPKRPGLQHHLGLCYAKVGLPSLAVEALRKALEQEPQDADVKLDLAVALDLASSPREAEEVYLELLRARPDDPRIVLNLGLLYVRRLQQPDKAREHLERFLELAPEAPDAAEIRRWLEGAAAPRPRPRVVSSSVREPPASTPTVPPAAQEN